MAVGSANESASNTTTDSNTLVEKLFVGEFDLLKLHQLDPIAFPFLLESVAQSQHVQGIASNVDASNDSARFDILFAFPQKTTHLNSEHEAEQFVQSFERDFASQSVSLTNHFLPFTGGWFAYFSYDYAQVVEPTLKLPVQQTSSLPLATVVRVPSAFVFDKADKALYMVTEAGFEQHFTAMKEAFEQCKAKELSLTSFHIVSQSEEPENKYLDGIADIKEYILSGDIFQVNLSRQWDVELSNDDAVAVYASLRKNNPAPFAALVDFGDWQVISSSPERLVRYRAPWVETRPIAGTRKRSDDVEQDRALIEELREHPKEIAEHIMLIDLERNDLGRICQPGTVEVNELMVIETYEHVHHIVSNVRGHLKSGISPLEVIHATFPGGTITGCPKVRCMEIIGELEQMPRLAYTGSLGYINRDGSLDFNILIRTMLKQGSNIQFRAGAGIVADSIAERELMESRHKAKGLIRALEAGASL
ncbi:aminodeoxychorismate synthase component I [Hydrogenovibrio marinus]|uniref:Aminodeoxychorismate synthase, component I n=1 Tax=Hydrogenovibrio marinus TaxID=28885 RepID=A0A066ZNY6_HYDMR|nr:aminodeoxychorismate synthase component I [Hydrogenovibrio marinus]KDN95538.1 hypothetical protein EI16_04355 [Hydrogenovibrio marinus]BBN60032.1 hypothetical protein HVMH_1626 [Hydrogenovibrio marinus]